MTVPRKLTRRERRFLFPVSSIEPGRGHLRIILMQFSCCRGLKLKIGPSAAGKRPGLRPSPARGVVDRRAVTAATDIGFPLCTRHNRVAGSDPRNSLPASGTRKDNNREMVIGRSEDRHNPWCPLLLRHHRHVWDPIRVPHLGRRSVDRAPKACPRESGGRTYGCIRPDQCAATFLRDGGLHIWAPAFESVTKQVDHELRHRDPRRPRH